MSPSALNESCGCLWGLHLLDFETWISRHLEFYSKPDVWLSNFTLLEIILKMFSLSSLFHGIIVIYSQALDLRDKTAIITARKTSSSLSRSALL